ncbi:MAG TPA: hypothetical protein H9898_08295, partial [Candidatus Anaerobiospirillum stercoravium]|nr:hypothetical protein [Candidatus Anaerobiospirillum stercoravium]
FYPSSGHAAARSSVPVVPPFRATPQVQLSPKSEVCHWSQGDNVPQYPGLEEEDSAWLTASWSYEDQDK